MVDAAHREVIQLMGEAGAIGEVTLGIRRKMPRPSSKPSFFPDDNMGMSSGMFSSGPREIVIHRQNLSTSFGFVLQSNTLRTGCMICECLFIHVFICIHFTIHVQYMQLTSWETVVYQIHYCYQIVMY